MSIFYSKFSKALSGYVIWDTDSNYIVNFDKGCPVEEIFFDNEKECAEYIDAYASDYEKKIFVPRKVSIMVE